MFAVVAVVLIATYAHLRRKGLIPALTLAVRTPAPELAARQVLAERFARGDMSTENFMERASVLNWTPGVPDSQAHRRLGRS